MAKRRPRSPKEFFKLLKHETATVHLDNGEVVAGSILAVDKDYGDVILEKADGELVLIPVGSYSYIELAKPDEPPQVQDMPANEMEPA